MGLIALPQRFTSQPQYAAPIDRGSDLARGLRGFWMPEGDGIALPRNKVTGNRSAAISGTVTPSIAPFGKAFTFSTGSIDTNESVSIAGAELTIAVRVKFPTSTGTRLFGNSTTGGPGYLIHQDGLGITVYLDGASVSTSSNLTAGVWGQVAFSYIGGASAVKLIAVDSVVTASAGSVSVSAQTATVKLGAYNWAGFPDYTGDAGYFAIWDRGLSEEELRKFQANPFVVLQAPPRRLYVTAASGTTLTGAGQIATAEAFGSAILVAGIAPVGIASTETLGAAAVSAKIAPAGIASTESSGQPVVAATVTAAGVSSTEAIGSASLSATVAPAGIATAEAIGQPNIGGAAAQDITAAGGIASTEASGAPALGVVVTPSAIATAEAIGQPNVGAAAADITDAGQIASAAALGAPAVGISVAPASIASTETIGAAALSARITATGVASTEAIGAPVVGEIVAAEIAAAGIASAEAFGSATIHPLVPYTGTGFQIGSGNRRPRPAQRMPAPVALPHRIGGMGIESQERLGYPAINWGGRSRKTRDEEFLLGRAA